MLTKIGDLPPPRRSIGKRIRSKAGQAAIVFFILNILFECKRSSEEAFDAIRRDTLDKICRIVPPKTVRGIATSSTSNPTLQGRLTRQPIIHPNEFRLLIVEPGSGSGSEEVHCRIINVTHSWRTRYDALSYTWGDETLQETIIVDGLCTIITKNLYLALVHLRDPVRRRLLWIDALCIDQDNPEERDEQVKNMGSIYSKAQHVVIWLGEQTEDVQQVFSIIKKSAKLAASSIDWSPVFNLLRHPWFQRTWIIQEAVLAREPILACGFETISWKAFSKCCQYKIQSVLPNNDPKITQALNAIT